MGFNQYGIYIQRFTNTINKNKMNQLQTINFINKTSGTKLIEHTDQFNSYDAFDDNYIVEIKNRRSNYKDPFLEVNKTVINICRNRQLHMDFRLSTVTN